MLNLQFWQTRRMALRLVLLLLLRATSGMAVLPLQFLDLGSPPASGAALSGSLPRSDDGHSGPIPITSPGGFPFSNSSETVVYVSTNGYFSFRASPDSCCPSPLSSLSSPTHLVAPYWIDNDITTDGEVKYEVHTNSSALQLVSSAISEYEEEEFTGSWMLVAEWLDVPLFQSQNRNTYQGILVTDGQRSYALFLYQCGQLQSDMAGIGYLADGNFFENHPLSNSGSSSDIACQNEPQSQWSNVIYQLDYRGPRPLISTTPEGPVFQAATFIHLGCTVVTPGSYSFDWLGYCTQGAEDQLVFIHYGLTNSSSLLRVRSTPDTCLDLLVCRATDDLGNTAEARFWNTNVTGVGVYYTAGTLPHNTALIANSSHQIGTISCHSASRESHIGRWIAPNGDDITFSSTDVFSVDLRSGDFPSYATLSLLPGEEFSASEDGVYSCVIPDENGVEYAIHIGLYHTGYSVPANLLTISRTSQEPFTLNCASTHLPPYLLRWKKGPTTLTHGNSFSISSTLMDRQSTTYHYTLTAQSDAIDPLGIYTCSFGTYLYRLDLPPLFLVYHTNAGVYEVGTNYTVTCTRPNNPATTEWTSGGVVIATASGHVVDLTLAPVSDMHHNGMFTCSSYDSAGIPTDIPLYLTIIVQVPSSVLVVSVSDTDSPQPGQPHTIMCLASKEAEGLVNAPSAYWAQDYSSSGVTVGVEHTHSPFLTSRDLQFAELRTSHAGLYVCMGQIQSQALHQPLVKTVHYSLNLTIPPPTVSLAPSSVSPFYAGSSLELVCSATFPSTVDTDVTLSVTWETPHGMVTDSTGRYTVSAAQTSSNTHQSTLTIFPLSGAEGGDDGEYRCSVAASPSSSTPYVLPTTQDTPSNTVQLVVTVPEIAVTISSSTFHVLDVAPYNMASLTCTAAAPQQVTASKQIQWTTPAPDGSPTPPPPLAHDGVAIIIFDSDLELPTSTSTLNITVDSAGDYRFTCSVAIPTAVEGSLGSADTVLSVRGASPPNVPTNLQTTATDFTSVRVSWDLPEISYTPETYTIHYGTDSSSLTQTSSIVHSGIPDSPGPHQFSLTVSGLQENVVYYFQVEAVNSVGAAQSQLETFMIEDVPVITSISSVGNKLPGQPLSLVCTAVVNENITGSLVITWQDSEGMPLQSGSDISISEEMTGNSYQSTLHFSPLRHSHSGEYTCVVEIADIAFTRAVAHTITVPIGDLSVAITSSSTHHAGSTLTLSCDVTSAHMIQPITYHWVSTCSGECFISGQLQREVSQPGLRAVDSGTHTCYATDSVGNSGSASITISVSGVGLHHSTLGPLTNNSIVVATQDGSIGSIQCSSGSTQPGTGTWIHPTVHSTGLVSVGGETNPGTAVLSLAEGEVFSEELQGVFSCEIPDENGKLQILSVGIYPYGFSTPISIGELSKDIVSSMFALKCTTSGSPPSLLSWRRNNHTLDMAAGLSFSQWQVITDRGTASYTSWLVVDGPPSLLHGTYQCSVSNELGSSSQDIQITGVDISGPELFTVGRSASLTCSSDLHVNRLEWLLDGVTVPSSLAAQDSLLFPVVGEELHGRDYVCRVTTPYGVLERDRRIIAEVLPSDFSITVSASRGVAVAGEAYSLTCSFTTALGVQGSPQLQWLSEDGDVLTSSSDVLVGSAVSTCRVTNVTLHFLSLSLEHENEYSCRASVNTPAVPYMITKTSTRKIMLSEEKQPPIPTNIRALSITTSSASIEWTITESILTPITYRVQYGESDKDLTMESGAVVAEPSAEEQVLQITLSGLKAQTLYYFKVIATNTVGTSSSEVESFETSKDSTAGAGQGQSGGGDNGGLIGALIAVIVIVVAVSGAAMTLTYVMRRRKGRYGMSGQNRRFSNDADLNPSYVTTPTVDNTYYSAQGTAEYAMVGGHGYCTGPPLPPGRPSSGTPLIQPYAETEPYIKMMASGMNTLEALRQQSQGPLQTANPLYSVGGEEPIYAKMTEDLELSDEKVSYYNTKPQ